jgi:protein O-mannosyl-transferase
MPTLLALTIFALYSVSLSNNYLNYDDDWLIENNPHFSQGGVGTVKAIWLDLSEETRCTFGAEYLPIRDTSMWLLTQVLGVDSARPIRMAQLALYILGMLFFRAMLRRIFKDHRLAEIAAWIFALHPIHVESVAWLAGHKDVLGLLFIGAALYVHAGQGKFRIVWVPLLIACAVFSKSMSVSVVALLFANDLLASRKCQWKIYAVSAVAVIVPLVLHVHVGNTVGMFAEFTGGSRTAAFYAMGPVWLRYAALSIIPWNLSIAHEVSYPPGLHLLGVAAYLAIIITGGIGIRLWWKKRPFVLGCWTWFVAPLIPVSQVVFPLQNIMADRYLWLSIMTPAIAIAVVLLHSKVPVYLTRVATVLILAAFATITCGRAMLFSDSELLFADGTKKTTLNARMPYQLGMALKKNKKNELAIAAFMETIRRAPEQDDAAARATNNLAQLLVIEGRVSEAEKWLRRGVAIWPQNEKIKGNLAKVLSRKKSETSDYP